MSGKVPCYVVVGGGIAGVTCIETLSYLDPDARITLISASPLIKKVTNFMQVTRVGELFDVEEQPLSSAGGQHKNIKVIHAAVESLSARDQTLTTSTGETVAYDKLCICTGGKPKLISTSNPHVIGIRDTESVQTLQNRLRTCRRVVIVGNGGIATELVHELSGCEVVWAIKDKSIASTFVDAGAGRFLMECLQHKQQQQQQQHGDKGGGDDGGGGSGLSKRHKYTTETKESPSQSKNSSSPTTERSRTTTATRTWTVSGGAALGPDWASSFHMTGAVGADAAGDQGRSPINNVHVEYQVEVTGIVSPDEFRLSGLEEATVEGQGWKAHSHWPVYIQLSNQKTFGCDLIISATGVTPFVDPFLPGNNLVLVEDGGIRVDASMQTSETNVYAAGDVCSAGWEPSPHWLQMRLWSQARQMGCYAAKCMVGHIRQEDTPMDFCFELFAHVTTFFNFKVIMLGKFNSQGLDVDGNNKDGEGEGEQEEKGERETSGGQCQQELLIRYTPGVEYVKAVLVSDRMVGAVLVGDTDLEETFENLVLNAMDLAPFKEHLLDPAVDIEDFFD